MSVHIRLDHSKSGLLALSEGLSGKHITIVYDFKLTSENSNSRVNEQIFGADFRAGHSLEEHSFVFVVEHLNGVVFRVVGE